MKGVLPDSYHHGDCREALTSSPMASTSQALKLGDGSQAGPLEAGVHCACWSTGHSYGEVAVGGRHTVATTKEAGREGHGACGPHE